MLAAAAALVTCGCEGEPPPVKQEWTQFKFDALHSGNVPDRTVSTTESKAGPGQLGLAKAVPLTDAVYTSPVVAGSRVFVLDGSGTVFCFDAATLDPVWKRKTRGGTRNCNNVSSPAFVDGYIHFGTTSGFYYVLDADDGSVVKEISLDEPVFSAPVVGADNRVYFATLGSRVYAVDPKGTIAWEWDFVREVLVFEHDRFSGETWAKRKKRVTWREQFCCSRNIALHKKTLVIPAGGSIVWLEDAGDHPELTQVYAPKESPSTLGLSLDPGGRVYRQWYRRDNTGAVEVLSLNGDEVEVSTVNGTDTSYKGAGSMSFSSVSIRARSVYRCRPESGAGFMEHVQGAPAVLLGGALSITPPVLVKNMGIFGGLDGKLYIVPLSGEAGERQAAWSFETAFKKAIIAPPAVCDGRVYFGCEDGYLYVLAPGKSAPLPTKSLELHKIRSPLTGKLTSPEHDWHTNFGNMANTNTNSQGIEPPFRIKWIRRFEGTVKHFSVCGGGRMYTHTAEGQIFAVEQETGRMLWRTSYPGVHVSYTAPLYSSERLYIPQAGLEECFVRCLDAGTGRLIWEAPFTGSPSWNRQQPPIIHKGLVIYLFSTGKYTPKEWLFEHQNTFGFPDDQKPILKAWNAETGEEAWAIDFSEYGTGGDDAGMCLMDETLFYSCYFGDCAPMGVTAAVDPASGKVLWINDKHAVHAGCAVSGKDGRLYLGGYSHVETGENPEEKINRVFCLDAGNGSLVWKSEPVRRAIHVITIRDSTLFTHAQYKESYLLDRATGKILSTFEKGYHCTRFTVSEPWLLGANMDIYDLDSSFALTSTGPALDVLLCVGAFASNGRIFFTTNGGGLQCSMLCGEEAQQLSDRESG